MSDLTVDFAEIGELNFLTLLRYCNAVSFKSTAPFDDLDYLTVEKIPLD